ncbi:MAG: hypothetical protein ACE15C_08460 [Phycisphaerae bacterium]
MERKPRKAKRSAKQGKTCPDPIPTMPVSSGKASPGDEPDPRADGISCLPHKRKLCGAEGPIFAFTDAEPDPADPRVLRFRPWAPDSKNRLAYWQRWAKRLPPMSIDEFRMLAAEYGIRQVEIDSALRQDLPTADQLMCRVIHGADADKGDDAGGKAQGRKRRGRRRTGRKPKPLTVKQTEAVHLYGELKGNISAVAASLGITAKSARERLGAAYKKLGQTGWRNRETRPGKRGTFKTGKLPTDNRGQVTVSGRGHRG